MGFMGITATVEEAREALRLAEAEPERAVAMSARISEVARNIMSNVKFAVESALGVPVVQVNVNVQDIRVSEEGGS